MIRYLTRLLCLSLVLYASTAKAQMSVSFVRNYSDTCKAAEVVGTYSGPSPKTKMVVPIPQVISFSVSRSDTVWNTPILAKTRVLRLCYKMREKKSPNCPWIYELEHLIVPCK